VLPAVVSIAAPPFLKRVKVKKVAIAKIIPVMIAKKIPAARDGW
jgi:hypothetical protein